MASFDFPASDVYRLTFDNPHNAGQPLEVHVEITPQGVSNEETLQVTLDLAQASPVVRQQVTEFIDQKIGEAWAKYELGRRLPHTGSLNDAFKEQAPSRYNLRPSPQKSGVMEAPPELRSDDLDLLSSPSRKKAKVSSAVDEAPLDVSPAVHFGADGEVHLPQPPADDDAPWVHELKSEIAENPSLERALRDAQLPIDTWEDLARVVALSQPPLQFETTPWGDEEPKSPGWDNELAIRTFHGSQVGGADAVKMAEAAIDISQNPAHLKEACELLIKEGKDKDIDTLLTRPGLGGWKEGTAILTAAKTAYAAHSGDRAPARRLGAFRSLYQGLNIKGGGVVQNVPRNTTPSVGTANVLATGLSKFNGVETKSSNQILTWMSGAGPGKVRIALPWGRDHAGNYSLRKLEITSSDKLLADHFKNIAKTLLDPKGCTAHQLTECVGEALTALAMHELGGHTMMLGFEKGVGVDQIWTKTGSNPTEYVVVEAKGPGAALTVANATTPFDQMSEGWIVDRLVRDSRVASQTVATNLGLTGTAVEHDHYPPGQKLTSKKYYYFKKSQWTKPANYCLSRRVVTADSSAKGYKMQVLGKTSFS